MSIRLPRRQVDRLARDGVSGGRPTTFRDLTARQLADALWLAYQQQRRNRPDDVDASPERPTVPQKRASPMSHSRSLSDVPITPRERPRPLDDVSRPAPEASPSPPAPVRRAVTRPAARVGALEPALDRAIPAALRPLRQTVSSPVERILDIEETARRALVDDRWLPVFTPADELRWDVVLVVDDSPSMTGLWYPTVSAFADVLRRQNAFRNVHMRLLHLSEVDGCTLRGTAPDAPRHDVTELVDPARRRIVFVLTDGVADSWRSSTAWSVLRLWGNTLPVVLVHLLESRLWRRTGLNIHRLRCHASVSGSPNRRWSRRPATPPADPYGEHEREDVGDLMPIPVVGLGAARSLRSWVELIAGRGPDWVDLTAVLVGPKADGAVTTSGEWPDVDPRTAVHRFREVASPTTFTLATYLAAAPLQLPLMESIQRSFLSSSGPAHLSELLASRLVRPGVSFDFEFVPGVREELLAASRRTTSGDVLRFAKRQVPEWPTIGGLDRKGDDEQPAIPMPGWVVTPMTESLIGIEMAVEQAMSGSHLATARGLARQQSGPNVRNHFGGLASGPVASGRAGLSSQEGHRSATRESRVSDTWSVNSTPIGEAVGTGGSEVVASAAQRSVIWGGVPPRNPNFTGRVALLDELNERLEPGEMTAVLPQALHGLGGVGKSQLAVEYAYRNRARFDVIWWIPAEQSVSIASSLAELGKRLELGVGTEANVAVPAVLDALRGGVGKDGRSLTNWLLIFDNAESPEEVRSYLPSGGPGRILVTSRNSQWISLARPLEVDVFERAESIQLLRRRGPDLTEDEADRLASALGDLPLAIEQAAAWRVETGMPSDEYIELLNEKQTEILGLPGPLDYQKPVAAAWTLSLEKLESGNPTALRILQICALLAPEPIPRTMFTNARSVSVIPELDIALRDRLRLNEAIRDLNRYALVRIDQRRRSIQMHRLVQAVLTGKLDEEERRTLTHGTHLLLAANDPNVPEEVDQWSRYSELYPHVEVSNAVECEDPGVRELVFNIARFLYYWGEHDTALEFSEKTYRTWVDRFGIEDVSTLRIGLWLGFMRWVAGRYREAAELNAELLEVHRRVLGENHEYTIAAIGSVAGDRRARGDFAGALELSRQNYELCVQRFRDDDELTLNEAGNLGVSLRLSGRFAEALELDEETWRRKADVFGADDPRSLLTQVGVTVDRRELGDYLPARAEQEQIVARYREVHGERNPATLRAIHHLAVMRRKAGDHDGATEAADEAHRGLNKRYGANHPDTIAAALSRAINFRQSGEADAARTRGEEVVERYRKTLGDDHPHTLSAQTVLAVVIRELGDAATACDINRAVFEQLTRQLGEDHPSTLVSAVNLASDLFALGRVREAYELDGATADQAMERLGADHPTTLACQANLAHDLMALGRTEEGEAVRAGVVSRTMNKLGPTHPAVAEFADATSRANCDIDPMPL